MFSTRVILYACLGLVLTSFVAGCDLTVPVELPQLTSVSGIVTNADAGDILPGTTVWVTQLSRGDMRVRVASQQTDANGHFDLQVRRHGTFNVVINPEAANGHRDEFASHSQYLGTGRQNEVNVSLRKLR